MSFLRRLIGPALAAVLSLAAGFVLAAPPPPVPPVPDSNRTQTYNITSPTPSIQVPFNVFGDCTDIAVTYDGIALVLNTDFTCASASGGSNLALLPLPITDMVITFATNPTTNLPVVPPTSGQIVISGAWHPRDLVQPTAPGINRREFNQTTSTLVAGMRELYHFQTTYASQQPIFVGTTPIVGAPANPCIFYSNAGTLGCSAVGTGLQIIGAALNLQPPTSGGSIGGVKSSSAPTGECATGLDTSGNIIYGTSCGGSIAYTQNWCSVSTPNCGTFTPGTTTQLTLTNPPASAGGLSIFFNGLRAYGSGISWTLSGSIVTFSQAIPSDITVVEAVSGVASGGTLASNVTYNQGQSGAVNALLSVVLNDDCINASSMFGANGTTGDGARIQAALNAAIPASGGPGCVFFPSLGTGYKIDTGLNDPQSVALIGLGNMNFDGISATVAQWTANGTWFECDGQNINPCISVPGHGNSIDGINFIWNQPQPPTAVTGFTVTASSGATSATVSSAAGLSNGMYLYGPGVLNPTTFTISGTTLTLSQPTYSALSGANYQAFSAYSPNVYQDGIFVQGSLFQLKNALFVGGSRCVDIVMTSASAGGTYDNLEDLRLDCLSRGIRIVNANDEMRLVNIDARPLNYQIFQSKVMYTEQNFAGLDFEYVDNPFVTNYQCLYCFVGVEFTNSTVQGFTHALALGHFDGFDCNLVVYCMYANSSAIIQFMATNFQAQQDSNWNLPLFNLQTDFIDGVFSQLTVVNTGGDVMALGTGTGGHIGIGTLSLGTNVDGSNIQGWGSVLSSANAFSGNANSNLGVAMRHVVSGPNAFFAGAGTCTTCSSGFTY